MERQNSPASARFHRWLKVAWVVTLWLPVLQMVHPVFPEGFTPVENRQKAPPPVFHGGHPQALKRSAESLEKYFKDAFGFRNRLIIANNRLHLWLLRTSPLHDVVIGEEGWLYYSDPAEGSSLADYAGLKPLAEKELAAIERNLLTVSGNLRRRGIAFALLVAPNKHTVYPEHLPPRIRALGGGRTRFDQVAARLARHPGFTVVDVRSAMLAAKARFPVYLRTDTHWNDYGAHIAARSLFDALARAGASVAPLPPEGEFVSSSTAVLQTDLTNMLGLPGSATEQSYAVRGPAARQVSISRLALAEAPRPGWEAKSCETGDAGLPRTLLLQDSFGPALWPDLCQGSSRSVSVWGYRLSGEMLARERPEFVVLVVAERNLGSLTNPGLF